MLLACHLLKGAQDCQQRGVHNGVGIDENKDQLYNLNWQAFIKVAFRTKIRETKGIKMTLKVQSTPTEASMYRKN